MYPSVTQRAAAGPPAQRGLGLGGVLCGPPRQGPRQLRRDRHHGEGVVDHGVEGVGCVYGG
eukprot:2881054-Rhodomonas_salina.1